MEEMERAMAYCRAGRNLMYLGLREEVSKRLGIPEIELDPVNAVM